jgi:UDP:flavonoid glycosyltransferase YjiC (YdhE family)
VTGPRVLMMPTAYAHGTVGATVRALSIARALRAAGAEVAFCAGGDGAAVIASEGYAVHPCPVSSAVGGSGPIRSAIDSLTWTGLAEPALLPRLVRAELDAIEASGADAVWAEFRPTAAISTAAAGVPLASIANWPAHPDFPPNRVEDPTAGAFNAVLRHHGQPAVRTTLELGFLRSELALAPTLPALEPELARAEPSAVFLGHTVDRLRPAGEVDGAEDAPPGRARGFVYLSVTGLDFRTYAPVLRDAFAGQPVDVVCAIGYHAAGGPLPVDSAEVRFFEYLPAQPVIARSQFVIFHGGHDTMLSALYHGVPSLVVPGAAAERQYNAERLADLGAGIVLQVAAFRPTRLRPALARLLDGGHRAAADGLARTLRRAGGCEEAAARIVSLTGGGAGAVREQGGSS